MIRIYGVLNSAEHTAALQLQELFLRENPELANSDAHQVTLIAGAKCHGQPVRDLDLVILANFDPPLFYQPVLSFANPLHPDRPETPPSVNVRSVCTIIEVKDHTADAIRFIGSNAEVKYKGEWHNATEQSEKQIYALRNYLSIRKLPTPYITNLIWFRNLLNADLPSRPHNMIAGQFTWNMLFSVIAQVHPPRLINSEWTLIANPPNEKAVDKITFALTEEITPTPLDRHRMEEINARSAQIQKLQVPIGRQLLILRGRGGSGKTIRLLQLAKTLYEEEGARILLLTYNKALVGDLRRILTILGVVDDVAEHSIRVQTIHSFFYKILLELGIITGREDDFLEAYDDLKGQAIQFLEAGLLLEQDFAQLKKKHSSDFLWDYVFIDEAQDWPDDERKILFHFYPHTVFAIADGMEQLVRSSQPADWAHSVDRTERTVNPLRTCLRMKAGLTHFVSSLAGQMGLPADEWQANEQVPGGRIIITEGESLYQKSFFTDLLTYNARTGNEPIDMLFCLPPNLAHQTDELAPVNRLKAWGLKIWDGTQYTVRDSYPTDNQQLRFVQYDSCRGLEGWMVVNFELDSFLEYKRNQLQQSDPQSSDSTAIRLRAIRWLFIPLTRAMDTLVIHLTNRPSPLKSALQVVANQYPDFVTWRDR